MGEERIKIESYDMNEGKSISNLSHTIIKNITPNII